MIDQLLEKQSGVHLINDPSFRLLDVARKLLESEQRFVALARSLPGGVRLREILSPTRVVDDSGLPIAEREAGKVELYHAAMSAPARRSLLKRFSSGDVVGLVVTLSDLAVPGFLEALAESPRCPWLVQDAQRASSEAIELLPSLPTVLKAVGDGYATGLWLFAPRSTRALNALIDRLGGIEELGSGAHSSGASKVSVKLELMPERLSDRNMLQQELADHLASSSGRRGVVVVRMGAARGKQSSLPAEELASVAEELGLRHQLEPGSDGQDRSERWAALFRQSEGVLLTTDSDAIESLPEGKSSLYLRLVAPPSLDVILDECLKLERRGGGDWVFRAPLEQSAPPTISSENMERLARYLAKASADGMLPIAVDAEKLLKAEVVAWDSDLESFGVALERALGELCWFGLLSEVRKVRFQLEVAECHRFRSPHIDEDERYQELSSRYDAALSQMDMVMSIRNRLNARPPKDLREMSAFLGYSIAELNILFDDLAREGIVIGRQVVAGAPGNSNFEVVAGGDEKSMLAGLPAALEAIRAERRHRKADMDLVARLAREGGVSFESLVKAADSGGTTAWRVSSSPARIDSEPESIPAPDLSLDAGGPAASSEAEAIDAVASSMDRLRKDSGVDAASAADSALDQLKDSVANLLAKREEVPLKSHDSEAEAAGDVEKSARGEAGTTVEIPGTADGEAETARGGAETASELETAGGRAEGPKSELRTTHGGAETALGEADSESGAAGAVKDAAEAAEGAPNEGPLARLEALLAGDVSPFEAEDVPALIGLAEGLSSLEDFPELLARIETTLGERSEDMWLASLLVLLREIKGEGEAAAEAVFRWLEVVPSNPGRNRLLPVFVRGLDYQVEVDGQTVLGVVTPSIRHLAGVLPVMEMLAPEEAGALIETIGIEGKVELGEFGSGTVPCDGQVYRFNRQPVAPETEGELWLRLRALEDSPLAPEVVRGRIAEAFLMVVGLADEGLTEGLAEAVLEDRELPTWMGASRRHLAIARASLTLGDAAAALESLEQLSDVPLNLVGDVAITRASALCALERPLDALRSLEEAGVNSDRGEGQAIWQEVTRSLSATCASFETCEGCPLLGSEYCPAEEQFWTILDDNPFGEPRRSLRQRVEKRGLHGLEPEDALRVNTLFNRLGGRWNEGLVTRWIANASGGRADDWFSIAQRLAAGGATPQALEALARAEASEDCLKLWMSLVRLRLSAGDLLGSIRLAQRAAAEKVRSWDEGAFGRELELGYGERWSSEPASLLEGLEIEEAAFLSRIAELHRARGERRLRRKRLEDLVKTGTFREWVEALRAYQEVLGPDAADSDPLVQSSKERLGERERRVTRAIQQYADGSAPRKPSIGELRRLVQDSEFLGLSELTESAKKLLTEVEAARKSRAVSREPSAEGPRGRSGARQRGRDGRSNEPRAAAGRLRGGRRDERKQSSSQKGRGSESDYRWRPGKTADLPPTVMDESGTVINSQLLDVAKTAAGDRERIFLIMPVVYDLLADNPEKGIKLIRDAADVLHHRGALDRPVAMIIREGRPADALLPRLRRVLERAHEGRYFSSALEELSTRESPEPWKAVLGQLKLKR